MSRKNSQEDQLSVGNCGGTRLPGTLHLYLCLEAGEWAAQMPTVRNSTTHENCFETVYAEVEVEPLQGRVVHKINVSREAKNRMTGMGLFLRSADWSI